MTGALFIFIMIKKIVCPTDFSDAANNALEYAAKLSQVCHCELLILHIEGVSLAAEMGWNSAGTIEVQRSARMAADRLKEICEEVSTMFKISVDYEVDITSKALSEVMSAFEEKDLLIVMGTNGADDLYQYFFGSTTYHVFKEIKYPVLVLPDRASYKPIEKIVFAWDYEKKSEESFVFLEQFLSIFHSQLLYLHVSSKRSEISIDIFRALRSELENRFGDKQILGFKQVFSENISEGIDSFVTAEGADILAINYYHRGVVLDFFHGKIARELSETAVYPLLILPI